MKSPTLLFSAFILLLLALPVASALADETPAPPDPQARLAELKSRLNLSEEQQAELKPLLEQHAATLKSIRGQYPADPAELSRKDKRAMAKAMRGQQAAFKEQLAGVLTPEQLAEWETMQKEMREQAKERGREQQQ